MQLSWLVVVRDRWFISNRVTICLQLEELATLDFWLAKNCVRCIFQLQLGFPRSSLTNRKNSSSATGKYWCSRAALLDAFSSFGALNCWFCPLKPRSCCCVRSCCWESATYVACYLQSVHTVFWWHVTKSFSCTQILVFFMVLYFLASCSVSVRSCRLA